MGEDGSVTVIELSGSFRRRSEGGWWYWSRVRTDEIRPGLFREDRDKEETVSFGIMLVLRETTLELIELLLRAGSSEAPQLLNRRDRPSSGHSNSFFTESPLDIGFYLFRLNIGSDINDV